MVFIAESDLLCLRKGAAVYTLALGAGVCKVS